MAVPATASAALSLKPASVFAAGDSPSSVRVGDLNNNSRPDLATANFFSNNVSVLLNATSHFGKKYLSTRCPKAKRSKAKRSRGLSARP